MLHPLIDHAHNAGEVSTIEPVSADEGRGGIRREALMVIPGGQDPEARSSQVPIDLWNGGRNRR